MEVHVEDAGSISFESVRIAGNESWMADENLATVYSRLYQGVNTRTIKSF